MNKLTKLLSAALLGGGCIVPSLSAGEYGLIWDAHNAGSHFAQFDVPSGCYSVSLLVWVSGSGGGFSQVNSNTWYAHYPYDAGMEVGAGGYVEVHDNGQTTYVLPPVTVNAAWDHITVNWGGTWVYTDGNYGEVQAVVYGGGSYGSDYFRAEIRDSRDAGSYYSSESGQPNAGTYWVEISGSVAGDGQATATVGMAW